MQSLHRRKILALVVVMVAVADGIARAPAPIPDNPPLHPTAEVVPHHKTLVARAAIRLPVVNDQIHLPRTADWVVVATATKDRVKAPVPGQHLVQVEIRVAAKDLLEIGVLAAAQLEAANPVTAAVHEPAIHVETVVLFETAVNPVTAVAREQAIHVEMVALLEMVDPVATVVLAAAVAPAREILIKILDLVEAVEAAEAAKAPVQPVTVAMVEAEAHLAAQLEIVVDHEPVTHDEMADQFAMAVRPEIVAATRKAGVGAAITDSDEETPDEVPAT